MLAFLDRESQERIAESAPAGKRSPSRRLVMRRWCSSAARSLTRTSLFIRIKIMVRRLVFEVQMEKLRVYYDREGNTLSVWFDDPKRESICEEADDDMVLVKDSSGRVIGFERLNYLSAKQLKDGVSVPVEVLMV